MRWVRVSLLVGIVVAFVQVAISVWPASAQGTAAPTSRTFVAKLNDANVNVWVAGIVDPDGWAAVTAASDDDAWNAQHARWFRGRVIDGQFTGQSGDGTVLTGRHNGSQIQGTVAGQPWTATLISGGTAGVYVGGNSQEVVAIIEAPDGSRIGRVWSRQTGQHLRTLIMPSGSSTSRGDFNLLSHGAANSQGSPATVTVLPNSSRQVQVGTPDQDPVVQYSTSWCNNSFCG